MAFFDKVLFARLFIIATLASLIATGVIFINPINEYCKYGGVERLHSLSHFRLPSLHPAEGAVQIRQAHSGLRIDRSLHILYDPFGPDCILFQHTLKTGHVR